MFMEDPSRLGDEASREAGRSGGPDAKRGLKFLSPATAFLLPCDDDLDPAVPLTALRVVQTAAGRVRRDWAALAVTLGLEPPGGDAAPVREPIDARGGA